MRNASAIHKPIQRHAWQILLSGMIGTHRANILPATIIWSLAPTRAKPNAIAPPRSPPVAKHAITLKSSSGGLRGSTVKRQTRVCNIDLPSSCIASASSNCWTAVATDMNLRYYKRHSFCHKSENTPERQSLLTMEKQRERPMHISADRGHTFMPHRGGSNISFPFIMFSTVCSFTFMSEG